MIRNQTGAGNWEKWMTRTARISSREFSCTPVCRHYFFLFKYFSSRVLNCNGTFFPQLISNVSYLSFHSSCPSSLSCDFTLLDKLKQIAPRTYSRAAKPSRFDFFFFLFFSQAKTCFLATGAAGLSLFPVLWQFWAWSPEKHINYPRWYHKGSCVSLPLKISQIFHMYLLFITKFLYLRAVRSFITFPAYGPQNRCLKTFFPVLSFNRMPVP